MKGGALCDWTVVAAAVKVVVRAVEAQARTRHWSNVREGELWFELGSCILGSQVRYENALAAARQLRKAGLLARPPRRIDLEVFEQRTRTFLLRTRLPKGGRYRFPTIRAKQLRQTASAIYGAGSSLRKLLDESKDSRSARIRLIERASGVGPKQASMFLRNIGFALDLAVIDVHVLRFLSLAPGGPRFDVNSVTSLRRYEYLEERCRELAVQHATVPAYLDTAIWVVMRALNQESDQ